MRISYSYALGASLLVTSLCSGQNGDSGLVLFYPFDGDALDYSGNHIDGTLSGATFTEDRFNNPNRALEFNGTNTFLTADSSSILDTLIAPITVTCWVRIDGWWDAGGYQWAAIMSKSEPALTSLQYRVVVRSDGTYWLAPNPECAYFQGSENPPLSTWFFMTVAHDTDSIAFFVDGVMTNSFPCTAPITTNTHPLFLGKDPHGVTEYFDGALDDFRIYHRALKGSEVHDLYETATQIGEQVTTPPFLISPNPASSTISVRATGKTPILLAELADMSGRKMEYWSIHALSAEVDLGDIARGIYVLTLRSAGQNYSCRIILD